jgi:hypothetical protein
MSTSTTLGWQRTDDVLSGREFRDLDPRVGRAFGPRSKVLRYGDAHGGWADTHGSIEYALCLDGRTLHRTGISGARPWSAHLDGETLTVPAGRRVFRVRVRDGAVVGYATLPNVEVTSAATLPDGRTLVVVRDEGVVRCRDEEGSLVPECAWAFEGARSLRVLCEGRAVLVTGDPARAAVWWLDGDDARVLDAREDFEDFVDLDGSLDETGDHFVCPAAPYVWDGGGAWLLVGLDALPPSPEELAAAPRVDAMPLPPVRAALPWTPLASATAPQPPTLPRTAPQPSGAHVKALVAWMRARPELATPDASLAPLLAAPLPDDLRAVLTAAAWHGVGSLALGEFWATQPAERESVRHRGTSSLAVHLGTLANGDDVIARLDGRRASVVIVSHEGDPDDDRGSLERFLSECVADARERGAVTSLDAHLPTP